MRRIPLIETESYRILRGMVDLSHLGPLSRAVAERVIHASADLDYAESLLLDERPWKMESGAAAVRPVGTDGDGAGRDHRPTVACAVSDPRAKRYPNSSALTRSAEGLQGSLRRRSAKSSMVVGMRDGVSSC